jgi:hypothetical protein
MGDCLYECGSGAPSTQAYHIYPMSASIIDLQMAPGAVCNKCNSYFSKLEQYFVAHHPGSCERLLKVNRTRKGKPPKFHNKAGMAHREDRAGESTFTFPLEGMEHKRLPNGDILLTGTFRSFPFDSVKIGRILAKIAVESLCGLDVALGYDPCGPRFAFLRRYARFGPGKFKFLWFVWKKSAEMQSLPKVIRTVGPSGEPVADVCRISLPGVTYVIPLSSDLTADRIRQKLEGWNIVETRGLVEQQPNTVGITLTRMTRNDAITTIEGDRHGVLP